QDAVYRGDQFDEFVDRPVALLRAQLGVVPQPFQLVEDGVLAFFPPVIKKHVLEQVGELGIGIDALSIMELCEQLDIKRQGQNRPCALAEHGARDAIGVDVEAIAVGQNLTNHCVDPAEQRLMLQLFIAETNQSLECNLVAEPMIVAQFQDFGVDEALNEPKDVGIGTALDLTHEPLFIGGTSSESFCQGQTIPQKLVGCIKAASPDHVFLYIPSHALGCLNAASIAVGVRDFFDRIHFQSPVSGSGDAIDRSANLAISKSAGCRESMTSPPEDMTET